MRLAILLLVAVCAGCPAGIERQTASEDDSGDSSGGGAGGAISAECAQPTDCVAAAPKCCDCPTHAVPADDPAQRACFDVDCAPSSCGSPMRATCEQGQCVLECAPVACGGVSCPSGFATDDNGCLTCACAATSSLSECSDDSECSRVRDDCCGCEMGGSDTAVPSSEAAAHDAALMCPENPSCPGGNTCAPDLAPRCVQGSCQLVAGPLPPNACGRADLPACPAGQNCTVNEDDQATMHGVGVCRP